MIFEAHDAPETMTKAYHKNDAMQVNIPADCKTFICDKFFRSYSVYVVSVLSRETSCFYLLFERFNG